MGAIRPLNKFIARLSTTFIQLFIAYFVEIALGYIRRYLVEHEDGKATQIENQNNFQPGRVSTLHRLFSLYERGDGPAAFRFVIGLNLCHDTLDKLTLGRPPICSAMIRH